MKTKKPKTFKCREKKPGCEVRYERWTSNIQRQACCQNGACLLSKADKNKEKREGKAAKIDRKRTKEQKEALKTTQQILNEAQVYCNKMIVLLDAGLPCISCGADNPYIEYCAGHFIARGSGANSALRFHRFNINGQCNKNCNLSKSGNVLEYEKGLILKIGQKNVDYLKHHPYKYRYSREDAYEIKAHFMAECLRLKKEQE